MKHHAFPVHTAQAKPPFRRPWLAAIPAILVALPGIGCYRATGLQRPDVVAEEITSVGGDRVQGLKAQNAPGDFYVGNDYVELAVDGTPFGARPGVAGAAGGGSIIDVGQVELDLNYKRVSLPSDTLDRLTPVLNQDPAISLVFDRFLPANSSTEGRLEMQGYVHDPDHKLTGATWDSLDRVQGLTVSHVVTLQKSDRFFLLQTTVTNAGSVPLPVRNIGDFLSQGASGGFRFNIPASEDMADAPLTGFGMEIPAGGPGTTFGDPSQAVKAPMVAFMGVEPVGSTEDGHITLGLLPVDADRFAVSTDPQQVLNQTRPIFPQRCVVGGLPGSSLAPGASLTHTRRLYLSGGGSASGSIANQATGLFNFMNRDRYVLRPSDWGTLIFQPAGTALRQSPKPTQFRIERNVGGTWKLERLEWMEPYENSPSSSGTAAPMLSLLLPVGSYRLEVSNYDPLQPSQLKKLLFSSLVNSQSTDRPDLPGPIEIAKSAAFVSNPSKDYICPERDEVLSPTGTVTEAKFTQHYFSTRQKDSTTNALQPARIMVFGQNGTADPTQKRFRTLSSLYSPVYKARVAADGNYGVYGFQAGNQLFAASMPSRSPQPFWLAPGEYRAYAIRGPLSQVDSQPLKAFDGQLENSHVFTAEAAPLPSGWTTFDLPGPSLGTSGGMLPVEKLSSALAEGVQIVAMAEKDRLVDSVSLANDFRNEFLVTTTTDADRSVVGSDPFVVESRSSDLGAFGSATALFTPAPRNERNGGARDARSWTLADFLLQAEGQFTVIHRPRGPQGLFTRQGFDRAVALGTGANAWWTGTGTLSSGRTHGQFDALELLRGEGCDPANPTSWFTEFLTVRSDWFALLNQQTPTAFTKGLGLSSAHFSLDTPVGLARTYLKATGFTQSAMTPVLQALQSGAAVASTGPLLDVTLTPAGGTTAYGPGSLVPGGVTSLTLTVNLWAPDWVPVDQLRVTINGTTQVLDIAQLQPLATTDAAYDKRLRRGTFTLTLPSAKDAWVVVEAGVPLATTGVYRAGTPWNLLMKGIYPIAITNPVFVDTNGGGYAAPGL